MPNKAMTLEEQIFKDVNLGIWKYSLGEYLTIWFLLTVKLIAGKTSC